MPRINKIRVTNIRYAEDTKRIPDIIFDADKNNLLFILANGGGKSLLLQLLLQCVLPNCKMGTRRIADMLINTKFTGHVLTEWLLDDEQEKYLLTGFCFTHALSDNRQVDFFNYTHTYSKTNLFDIQNIPLIENQTPVSFTAFRKMLQNSDSETLQLFETQKSYKDYLAKFHIYAEEWENIRITNAEEGGVGKFFSNCKSSIQFLENIAIPSIERALFENQNEREVLLESFKKHHKSLLEIPQLQKNIEDYGKITEIAAPLLKHIEVYDHKEQERNALQKKVVGLHTFLVKDIERAKANLAEINTELEIYHQKTHECQWKIESHHYYLSSLEKNKLSDKIQEIDKHLLDQQNLLSSLQEEERKLNAFSIYADILEQQNECQRITVCIEQVSKKNPDLQKEMQLILNQFSYAWKQVSNKVIAQKEENFIKRQELQNSWQELITQNKLQIHSEKTLLQEKAVLTSWMEEFSKQQLLFSKNFDLAETQNPILAQNTLSLSAITLNSKIEQLKREKEIAESELGDLQTQFQAIIIQTAEKEASQKELQKNLLRFEKDHENLINQLVTNKIIQVTNLLSQKNSVNLTLEKELFKEKENLKNIAGRREDIRKRLNLLQEMDFSQIKLIEAELTALMQGNSSFPSLCIAKQKINGDISRLASVPSEQNYFVFTCEETLAIWDQESFELWKDGLNKKLQNHSVQEMEKQSQYELLLKISGEAKQFYQLYSEALIHKWRAELIESKNTLETLEKSHSEIIKQRVSLLKNREEKENYILNSNQDLYVIKSKLYEIKNFLEFFNQNESKIAKLQNILEKLQELENQKETQEAQLQELQQKLEETKETSRELENQTIELNKTKLKYLFKTDIQDEKSETEYFILLTKLEALSASANLQQSDLGELNKSLEKSQSYLQKERIRLTEILRRSCVLSLEYLKENYRTVQIKEWDDLKQKIEEKTQSVLSIQQEKETTLKSFYKNEGVLEEIKKNILQKFNKNEVYLGFNKSDHLLEANSIKKDIMLLEGKVQELGACKNSVIAYASQAQKAVEWIASEIVAEFLINYDHPWLEKETLEINQDPLKFAQNEIKYFSNLRIEIEKQRRIILNTYNEFIKQLRGCNNNNLYDFIRETELALSEERLFDFNYIGKIFLHIDQSVQSLKEQSIYRLEQLELNKKQIVERITARIKEIYKDLSEISRHTKITLYDRPLNLLKIDGPVWQDEVSTASINTHLKILIDEIKIMEASGKTEDDINNFITNSMTSRILLNACIGLEKIRVTVFKPKQESMFKDNKIDMLRWDEVERWSGGEKFCAYMGAFLAITSYLRSRSTNSTSSWRVLLADNPFGIASSKHILDPIFTMADLNKIQLVCFTAHSVDTILKRFHSIYSLKLVPAFGRENMRFEKIEKGFYIEAH